MERKVADGGSRWGALERESEILRVEEWGTTFKGKAHGSPSRTETDSFSRIIVDKKKLNQEPRLSRSICFLNPYPL